jgi:hypothetical protein
LLAKYRKKVYDEEICISYPSSKAPRVLIQSYRNAAPTARSLWGHRELASLSGFHHMTSTNRDDCH